MKMWIYIIRRAILLIPVIIGVMTITFVAVSALPIHEKLQANFGNPKGGLSPTVPCSSLNLTTPGYCPNPVYLHAVHTLGLDQPIYVQWGIYIRNSLTLNWGMTSPQSWASTQLLGGNSLPIVTVLGYWLPYTLELAAISLVLILLLALPIGNYAAVYRNRPIDQGARGLSFTGYALPPFMLATLILVGMTAAINGIGVQCGSSEPPYLQIFGSWPPPSCFAGGAYPSWIGQHLQTSPTGFPTADALIHGQYSLAGDTVVRLLLPAIAIAYGSVGVMLRFVRNSMLEVMNLDFVRTARAKGVPESIVIRKHAGRNSLNVTITILGLAFAGFIAGFPIIEEVFGLKGIGLLLAYSVNPNGFDFGLIFGTTLLFTIIVVIANICVDILYAYLDPRVRLG